MNNPNEAPKQTRIYQSNHQVVVHPAVPTALDNYLAGVFWTLGAATVVFVTCVAVGIGHSLLGR